MESNRHNNEQLRAEIQQRLRRERGGMWKDAEVVNPHVVKLPAKSGFIAKLRRENTPRYLVESSIGVFEVVKKRGKINIRSTEHETWGESNSSNSVNTAGSAVTIEDGHIDTVQADSHINPSRFELKGIQGGRILIQASNPGEKIEILHTGTDDLDFRINTQKP